MAAYFEVSIYIRDSDNNRNTSEIFSIKTASLPLEKLTAIATQSQPAVDMVDASQVASKFFSSAEQKE